MTGIECLYEELKRLGFNGNKIMRNADLISAVVGVLAGKGEDFISLAEEDNRLSEKRAELSKREDAVFRREWRCKRQEEELESLRKDYLEERERNSSDIENAVKALLECETAEGRDAMRRVQVFKNEVKIDTKYDNTAYIIALGAILSDGAIGAIDELKKINAKPFSTYSKEWQRKWERRF